MSGPQNVRPELAGEQALRFGKRRGKSGCKEALGRLASLNDRHLVDHIVSFDSYKVTQILEFDEVLLVDRNPGFWNPEFISSNS